jgi:hypothetical protein
MHTLLCGDVDSIVITTTYTKHQNYQTVINHFIHQPHPLARSLIL